MQLRTNGEMDAELTRSVKALAHAYVEPRGIGEAGRLLQLLESRDETAFTAGYMEHLHHYTALPQERLQALADTPGPATGVVARLYRRAVQHLMHARILPLGRWLLWRQSNLNRALADGLRFESERASRREKVLTRRVEQLEAEIADLRCGRGGTRES